MYDVEILNKFRKVPVFSLSDVNQIINNRVYAKKFLNRLVKTERIFRVKRDIYTIYRDPLLISTFLINPSYISTVSALSYHRLIMQIPNEVFCITSKSPKKINFTSKINFFHTDYFFGFRKEKYESFMIPLALPEKAIIDSVNIFPISVFEEAFEKIKADRMIEYLKKIRKSNLIKRIGYLMEKHGHDRYKVLKKYINYRYLPLDPLLKNHGVKDKKWRLIINTK